MIPGSNLLNKALSVIAKQEFGYKRFLGRTPNDIGLDVSQYSAQRCTKGSIQPVPRNVYTMNGLDFQRTYVNVYVSRDVTDIDRDVAGDLVLFKGVTYECISRTPWHAIDGWDQVLAVKI